MKPIKLKCRNCDAKLRAGTEEAGTISQCPKCGNQLAIPFPGIDRGAFFGWVVLKYLLSLVFATGMGDGVIILAPIFLFFSLFLAYLRAINIGHGPWWTLVAFVPFSIFYFGFARTGAARKQSLKDLDSPPNDIIHPSIPTIPAPDEIEARTGTVLTQQEKQIVSAVMEGASMEEAAAQAGTTAEIAKAIYGAFFKAFNNRPESERQAFLNTTLDTANSNPHQ